MQGWVSLYRELLHKPIWTTSTPEQKTVLVTLLLMANHEDNEWEFKGEKFTVKKGQMITSLESIVTNCGKGVTIQNVRTALKRFEKLGFLTNESTNKNRLITLVNWASFQHSKDEPNKQVNKQLTSNQQATNKQLTTNNNDNNVKKDNNDISSTTKAPNAFEVYEQNFGILKPLVIEDINYWIDQLNEEIVIASMKVAVKRNKTSFGYCEGILKSWLAQGVKSLDDARALERKEANNKNESAARNIESNNSPGLNALSL
ncbi:DnaD-like helicase loader [Bacillus phage Palmer]|uniref:DnaD/DnaB replication protein n=1 Tax=Bacillus phage Palmer TaxID=1597966 RepID=A0A0C5AN80_9CAUD|nr:DnaD-like helicase loader [Bacillus phage Palmer]AJK28105.1 DnaD/DnaB replication protein [Bacillus phage Palmer]